MPAGSKPGRHNLIKMTSAQTQESEVPLDMVPSGSDIEQRHAEVKLAWTPSIHAPCFSFLLALSWPSLQTPFFVLFQMPWALTNTTSHQATLWAAYSVCIISCSLSPVPLFQDREACLSWEGMGRAKQRGILYTRWECQQSLPWNSHRKKNYSGGGMLHLQDQPASEPEQTTDKRKLISDGQVSIHRFSCCLQTLLWKPVPSAGSLLP